MRELNSGSKPAASDREPFPFLFPKPKMPNNTYHFSPHLMAPPSHFAYLWNYRLLSAGFCSLPDR